MEGEAAAAILQVLVQNLIDSSKKEISLIRDLDKDVEKLTGTLHTIQNFLNDAEMRTVPDEESVKNWLKKLEDAAFDADHVLDEVNYHILSNKIKKPEKKKKVLSCFSFSNHITRPRKMALKIKEISQNLDAINKEATELGLVERLANVSAVPDVGYETDSYTLDPIFIGRDDVVSEIVDKILTATEERVISTLSIVGMGGLGKTTLTRKVFNHEKIETQFGSRIWVHVSRNFDLIVLLKKILKELSPKDEGESRQDTMRKLSECLKDKAYLLVLDDVWNEDPPKWEDFMNALLGVTSTEGNAIVVTTRNTVVASTVNPLCIHRLKGLSEEDCWSIIKEKTFGRGVDVPPEIETTGRNIARRCQGSPLAANVVGGVLQHDKSEENWLSIQQKWLSRDDGENITRIFRLSFDSLSSASLKKCFAYCSMFPKGHKIKKQELIEQWMAEGFLQPNDGSNGMESVGEKFINILLNNSLLQVLRRDGRGNVESCVMHDLVHDLACSILGSSVSANGSSRVQYMILNDELSFIDRREMKYFRTLILMKPVISGADFSHFECLHALTLADDKVEELPSSIKKLIHLRKLNISGTNIKSLPEWIGELHYLQTLRAENGCLKKLPSTMKYLNNIRHLYLDVNIVLPTGIGRLTSLQTLRNFRVGDDYGDREGHTNDEEVLEGLQPPADLKKLVIWGFKGRRFPAWTVKMAVQNVPGGSWIGLNKLIQITLFGCYECEEIPMLGHLPNLKYLGLRELRNLKCINSSVYGLANKDTLVAFPALETLELLDMPKLAEWAEVESSDVQVFPRLQSLTISTCNQLMSVPTHSSSRLKHLKIYSWKDPMQLANIFHIKYALLTELNLSSLYNLECLPDWLFNENLNLSKLRISMCPKLRELPPGLRTLASSLQELNISCCPSLERIRDDSEEQSQSQSVGSSSFFTSLRSITIIECEALACLPCELVGSSLEDLRLESLSCLMNLTSLLDCMARSSRLSTLIVVGVPKFMATSRVEVWPFGSLGELDIDASVGGSIDTVDVILQGCSHSLVWLKIRGMEDWESLPRSIERLTVIESLKLENFGMEEIPEWFGNLSSSPLYNLCITDCKKLRRLPSMDAMRRLQTLNKLIIEGCPELLAKGVADPEWPKISHIPYITIDGIRLNAADVEKVEGENISVRDAKLFVVDLAGRICQEIRFRVGWERMFIDSLHSLRMNSTSTSACFPGFSEPQKKYCYCRMAELLVNVWAYHSLHRSQFRLVARTTPC